MQTTRTRRPLTRDDIASIQAAFAKEKPAAIAARYGCSTGTVTYYCKGVIENPRRRLTDEEQAEIERRYLAGDKLEDIAARYRRHLATIARRCRPLVNRNRRKQLVDPEMAAALAGEGVLQREIAALYGASAVAVCRAIKRHARRRRHG